MKNLEKKILKFSLIIGVNVICSTNMIAQANIDSYPDFRGYNGYNTQQNNIVSFGDSGFACYLRLHRNVYKNNDIKEPSGGISYMLNNLNDGFSISRSIANNIGNNIRDVGTKDFIIDQSGNASFKGNLNANSFRVENQVSFGGSGVFNIDAPSVQGGRLTVLGTGNVGIGNANPSAKLDVTGTVNATGLITATDGVQIGAGSLGAGANGPMLSFSTPTPIANDDNLYIRRVNETNGGSNIFVNIGNDNSATNLGVRDTFTIGNDGTGAGSLNSFPYFTVNSAGYVSIGTVGNASQKLWVNGGIIATNYTVNTAATMPDYVFEDSYKLKTLAETETYIKENKHLPAFKSAKHYEANGYTMIDMDVALEQTVEELTLHAIAQEKKIVAQETEMAQLKSEMAAIKALLLKK